jgi:hypothetical protein
LIDRSQNFNYRAQRNCHFACSNNFYFQVAAN